jgi:hypothetical protein
VEFALPGDTVEALRRLAARRDQSPAEVVADLVAEADKASRTTARGRR